MAGKTIDPKRTRITVRLSDGDLKSLNLTARKRGVTVGAVVRDMIRAQLAPAPKVATKRDGVAAAKR